VLECKLYIIIIDWECPCR